MKIHIRCVVIFFRLLQNITLNVLSYVVVNRNMTKNKIYVIRRRMTIDNRQSIGIVCEHPSLRHRIYGDELV